MLFNLREFYLPANFISIFIGLELAGYFLYQYKKLKVQKMGMDKFLLAFGIFFYGVNNIFLQFFGTGRRKRHTGHGRLLECGIGKHGYGSTLYGKCGGMGGMNMQNSPHIRSHSKNICMIQIRFRRYIIFDRLPLIGIDPDGNQIVFRGVAQGNARGRDHHAPPADASAEVAACAAH